ncbi:MAG: sensor histidine kinase [Gammaproteobacteria bacterium]|nr:sensor histidine kinase [Gammaproteobacteria bacterium]MBU1775508.1 sensor histidine kinase [Gammaproteobacteria bacterium]MBU1968877.1 sensor histidine kinase [Gammaproteobacteria bacterium]
MSNLHNRSRVTQALFSSREFLHGLSLQSRFLLIVGVSSLILSLLLWWMFGNFNEQLIERIGARFAEKQMLYDKERTLQPLIREIALARETADSSLLRAWAMNERDPQARQAAILKMEKMRHHFRGGNYFLALAGSGDFYYNDAKGKYDGRQYRYTLNPSVLDDAWFFDFMKRGDCRRIRVSHNDKLNVSKIWIRVPILDDGKVIGVLGTGIDLDDFIHNISNIHQPGVTNMFINQNAVIQIYNDVDHIDFPGVRNFSDHEHSSSQILSSDTGNQWVHQAITSLDRGNHNVETEFVHIKGKRYLAGMIALPDVGWYDLTLLDLSVLLPKMDFLELGLAIIVGTLGLLAILAYSLHRMVLKPVASLTDAASRIRRGEYASLSLEDNGGGEVQVLASQFQDMENSLFKTQEWLEAEIDKRTSQLFDAQSVLEISLQREREGREIQAHQMAVMAHEMRNPIAVIGNTAQMLQILAQTDHPELLPRIEKITRAVRQLAALMDNFLTEKWLEMWQHGLKRTKGDLNRLCTEVIGNIVDSHARRIQFAPLAAEATIYADWELLQIAVTNLLDNACKYSCQDSNVVLKVLAHSPDQLCLEISDCAGGIPHDLQDRIFEKYVRGQHTADIQGTGLGLYLVNWIARFHGGHMEISSVAGQGSTFHLCLPISEPHPEKAISQEE